MDTNELIKALAADTGRARRRFRPFGGAPSALAVAVAAAVFLATLGPRPDIAAAAGTPRFLFKFVVTLTLAGECFRPCRLFRGQARACARRCLILQAGPALVAVAVAAELLVLPPETWPAKNDRHEQHRLPDLTFR